MAEGASSINGAQSTMIRVADAANDKQQLNLDFINYITDLTGGVDDSSAYATDVTIDADGDSSDDVVTNTDTTSADYMQTMSLDDYNAGVASGDLDAADYSITDGDQDDTTVARYQTSEYMSSEYSELYESFGSNLFDDSGVSSLVDSDGVFTAGGSSLVNYYTQNLSDSITVLAALTKSTSTIQRNAMQTFGRDLAQA